VYYASITREDKAKENVILWIRTTLVLSLYFSKQVEQVFLVVFAQISKGLDITMPCLE